MGALAVGGWDPREAMPALAEDAAMLAATQPEVTAAQRLLASICYQAAHATVSDPELCREMAGRVEAIAWDFLDHDGIQKEARLTRSYLPQDAG